MLVFAELSIQINLSRLSLFTTIPPKPTFNSRKYPCPLRLITPRASPNRAVADRRVLGGSVPRGRPRPSDYRPGLGGGDGRSDVDVNFGGLCSSCTDWRFWAREFLGVFVLMANQVVKVRREAIASCMTCPLCNRLFRDATTISECLHTFCRRCIYDKISDEELESCPVCNIDLGCSPLEKLRPDHSLQDVRAKIFPSKRIKVKAPEPPSVTLPVRRKERSLSSLVVSTPRVSSSSQTAMTGRRTKGVARKASAFRNSSFSSEKPDKKEEFLAEDQPQSSGSPEIEDKFMTPNTIQNSFPGGPSEALPDKEKENGTKSWESKMDLWKPLNCLVEVANRTKSFKSSSQAFDAKLDTPHIADRETLARRNRRKPKIEDENHVDPGDLDIEIPKKVHKNRRKRASTSEELGVSPQDVLGANHERRLSPIWFSLVPSEEQEGDTPLPQIPASYLRVKDGNVPVSFVQKYLVRKLNLEGETQVEIRCMGQPVSPSLQLYHLVDLWLQTTSSQRIQASIGSSAKDFVMLLSYAWKSEHKHRPAPCHVID